MINYRFYVLRRVVGGMSMKHLAKLGTHLRPRNIAKAIDLQEAQ